MARDTYISDDWDDNALTGRTNPETGAFPHPNDDKHAGDILVGMYRPEWTVDGGTPSVTSGHLVIDSSGEELSTASEANIGSWEHTFNWSTNDGSGEYRFTFLSTVKRGVLAGNGDGYYVRCQNPSGGSYDLQRSDAGTRSNVVTSTWAADTGVIHSSRADRDPYGNFELFYDGTSQGTATDTNYDDSWVAYITGSGSTIHIDDLQVS